MSNTAELENDQDIQEEQPLPPQLETLAEILGERPEVLATGSEDLHKAALDATKYVYDLALATEKKAVNRINEFLVSISPSAAPQTRSQSRGSLKRKRGPSPPPSRPTVCMQETPLAELFVEGMSDEQIWAELELRAQNMCEVLNYALDGPTPGTGNGGSEDEDGSSAENEDEEEMDEEEEREYKKMRQALIDEGFDPEELERLGLDEDEDDEDEESEQDEDEEESEDEDHGEDVQGLRDPSDEEDEDLEELESSSFFSGSKNGPKRKSKRSAHPVLDDGFFNLAAFNAETEAAESRNISRGKLSRGEDDDEDDDDADSVDLFAPVDDGTAVEEVTDGGEPFYRDFFEPPRPGKERTKKLPNNQPAPSSSSSRVRFHEEVRVRKIKAKGKNLPVSTMFYEEEEEDDDDDDDEDDEYEEEEEDEDESDEEESESSVEDAGQDVRMLDENSGDSSGEQDTTEDEDRSSVEDEGELGLATIERLKDDLFAEDDDNSQEGMSSYEKRMAALREEIAALEAENVGKKEWTLLGEATSRSRPQNSLLEQDLEFERIMKSVPVITEDVVHSLEERIKTRIAENQFDDVVRKRPVDDKPFLPSRFFELQDTKSKQSLAEIYEDEYTAAQTGGVAGEDRDGKLQKEHQEIQKLWEHICGKLDALCNAHFTPKAPKGTITSVSNVAAATLESALPSTKATSTMLAPEEVYTPSSLDLRARSELTPGEKQALRNKQKKTNKKARDAIEKSVVKYGRPRGVGDVKRQKDAALKTLVKSGKGVTVVGKKRKEEGTRGRGKTKT